MTLKEKQIASLRRKIAKTQDFVDRYSEKLKQMKDELETAEMDNLKAVLNERGLTIDEILKTINSDSKSVVNETKKEPENKAETKTNLEEKKNVGF